MGQVTALTAEKTLELLAQGITGAHLSGYNLILHRDSWDPASPLDPETTINLGSVRGATGATGGISEGQLNDAINNTGLGVISYDNAGSVDDPLGSAADTWYTLAGVSVTTPSLISGRHYSVDYFAPLLSATDLTSWDLELMVGSTTLQRANVFTPNGGRSGAASGTYHFTASSGFNGTKHLTMRARGTTAGVKSADNSVSSASIAVMDHGTL